MSNYRSSHTVDPRRLHHQQDNHFASPQNQNPVIIGSDPMPSRADMFYLSPDESATMYAVSSPPPWTPITESSWAASFGGLPVVQEGFTPCVQDLDSPQISTWASQSCLRPPPIDWTFNMPHGQPQGLGVTVNHSPSQFNQFSPPEQDSEPQSASTEHPSDYSLENYGPLQSRPNRSSTSSYYASPLILQSQSFDSPLANQNCEQDSTNTYCPSTVSLENYKKLSGWSKDSLPAGHGDATGDSNNTSDSQGSSSGTETSPPLPQSTRSPRRISKSRRDAGPDALSSSNRPFECDNCGWTFPRKSNLKYHMRVHEKNRKSVHCPIPKCQKSYGRQADLTRHIKSFHERRNFTCEYCGKGFNRSDILSRHIADTCIPAKERLVRSVALSYSDGGYDSSPVPYHGDGMNDRFGWPQSHGLTQE